MRITVGHILILAGLGGAGYWYVSKQDLGSPNFTDGYSSVTDSLGSLINLFKSGAQPTPEIATEKKPDDVPPETPKVEEKLPALETALPEPTTPPPAQAVPIEEKSKAPLATATTKKMKTKSRRSGKKRAVAPKDPLLGNLVTLTLASGRDIKGVLIERTATSYKIEMPGMGPFTYDAAKVVAIKPAK
jgi:hypothetical protein